jgi:hypothetical protein
MTDEEFDNISFRKGDIIEVRHFFKTEVEEVEYVNIIDRYINNYKPHQIQKYIPYDKGRTETNRKRSRGNLRN